MDQAEGTLADELASFRQEWHEELYVDAEDSETNNKNCLKDRKETYYLDGKKSIEAKAVLMFMKATKLEEEGDFNAAVYYYREAVRLVPDIELKITEYQAKHDYDSDDEGSEDEESDDTEQECSLDKISKQFSLLHVTGLCSPEQPYNGTHISALPTELLMSIFRWVVSKEVDTRSLSQLSLVCKWFYACARDEELWKLICMRTWGLNYAPVKHYENSWRKMFVEKPHLRFDGVYISENSYVRTGEQGVNSFYKPFHLIVYYKFLRFFPDGTCVLYTSAEEPKFSIRTLQSPPYRDPHVYVGYYRMTSENTVNVFYSRETKPTNMEIQSRRRKNRDYIADIREHNYYMQLSLSDTRKAKNNKLSWKDYTCKITHSITGITSENEIDWEKFKPFIFSRVRSYTAQTTSCL